MHAQAFLKQHFRPDRNAIEIGKCVCGREAWATLHKLPGSFDVTCEDRSTHKWSQEVHLAPELSHLEMANCKRKTTKGRLLEEINSWDHYRNLAPDMETTSTELVLFEPTLRGNTSGATPMADVEDVEEVPRPGFAPGPGPALHRPSLPGAALEVDGVVVHKAGPQQAEKGRVCALFHLLKTLAIRHGPQLLHDAPILITAWNIRNGDYFYAALLSVLPRYFTHVPNWLDEVASPHALVLIQEGLEHPYMQHALHLVRRVIDLPANHPRIAVLPLSPEEVVPRRVLEEVQRARALLPC